MLSPWIARVEAAESPGEFGESTWELQELLLPQVAALSPQVPVAVPVGPLDLAMEKVSPFPPYETWHETSPVGQSWVLH